MTLQMDLPTADEYPTRKAAEAALLYRKDPTVWGDQNSGPFSDEELRGYDQRGYTQIESLISGEEVQTYSEELKRLGSDSELRKDERVVVEPTSDEVRSVFEAHKISPLFADLSTTHAWWNVLASSWARTSTSTRAESTTSLDS